MSEMPGSDREQRLERILAEYLRAVDGKQSPNRDALLAGHPDLAEELQSFFRNRDALERLAQPLRHQAVPLDATLGAAGPAGQGGPVTIRYFGDYELLEVIARGGMGVVHRARQVSLNRIVALKMIRGDQLPGPAEVQRFRAEAENAANLEHPNIVPIYEIGDHEGQHYFSMKFVEGGSLAARVPALVADPRRTATLLARVARAVHFAHQRGILHRDLKPANVLLEDEETPLVTDFGLARRMTSPGGQPGEKSWTQTGVILGTPAYMAPEQARAEKQLSTACDVYALGVILYECLVGQVPFRADNALDLLLLVIGQEPVHPRSSNPEADPDLSIIALKCLHKEPARRYESAAALADDLDRWLRGEAILARPAGRVERGWRWCRRNPVVAALTLLLVATLAAGLAGAVFSFLRIGEALDLARDNALDAEEHARIAEHNAILADQRASAAREAALQAERRRLEVLRLADQSQRTLGQLCLANARQLEQAEDHAGSLAWLAEALRSDGDDPRRRENHRLRLQSELSRLPRLVGLWKMSSYSEGLHHSPDGQRILVQDAKGSILVEASTGQPLSAVHDRDASPVFGPDSRRLVLASKKGVILLDAVSGNVVAGPIRLGPGTHEVRFSADGRRISIHEEKSAQLLDGITGQPVCDPLRPRGKITSARFILDDRCLLVIGGDPKAPGSPPIDGLLVEANTGKPFDSPLPREIWMNVHDISSDGRRVVATTRQGKTCATRVWDRLTGQPISPPLVHPWNDRPTSATFGFGGKRLLTVKLVPIEKPEKGSLKVEFEVRLWNLETGQQLGDAHRVSIGITQIKFTDDDASVLLSGRHLDWSSRIYHVLDAATGRPRQAPLVLTNLGESSDERYAVTVVPRPTGKEDDPQHELRIVEVPTGKIRYRMGYGSSWNRAILSPDSKHLFSMVDGSLRLYSVTTPAGSFVELPNRNRYVYGAAFSPDGRLLCLRGTDQICLHDVTQPTRPPIVLPHGKGFRTVRVRFNSHANQLITIDSDDVTRLWDLVTGPALETPLWQKPGVARVWLLGERGVLQRRKDGVVQVVDRWTAAPLGVPFTPGWGYPDLTLGKDGRHVAVQGYGPLSYRVWDVLAGKPVGPAILPGGLYCNQVQLSDDGRRLLLGQTFSFVRVFDTRTAKPLTEPVVLPGIGDRNTYGSDKWSPRLSPDGRWLLTVSWNWLLGTNTRMGYLRDLDQPASKPQLISLPERIDAVCFLPGGTRLLLFSGNKVRAWDHATGKLTLLKESLGFGPSPFLSPDGKRIVALTSNRVAIHDAVTLRPFGEPGRHEGLDYDRVVFSKDHQTFVTIGTPAPESKSAGTQQTVIAWDATTGKPLTDPLVHPDYIRDLCLSDDGRRLAVVVGYRQHRLYLWDLPSRQLLAWQDLTSGHFKVSFSPDGTRILLVERTTSAVIDNPNSRVIRWTQEVSRDELLLQADRLGGKKVQDGVLVARTDAELEAGLPGRRGGGRLRRLEDLLAWHQELVGRAEWFTRAWHLSRLIEARPGDDSLYHQRAEAWQSGKQWRKVLADCTRVLELNRQVGLPSVVGGLWANVAGGPDGPFRAAVSLARAGSPDSSRARMLLVEALDNLGRLDDALREANLNVASWPTDDRPLAARGEILARLGRYREAGNDLARAVRIQVQGRHATDSAYPGLVGDLGLTHLALGDRAGFRRCCRSLTSRRTEEDRSDTAHEIARYCVLTPDAVTNWTGVVRLAEEATKAEQSPEYLTTLGAALYRAGRHAEAIEKLRKGQEAGAESKPATLGAIFLALAHQGRDAKSADARKWRHEAEKKMKETPKGEWTWQEWVQVEVLGRELRARVPGP